MNKISHTITLWLTRAQVHKNVDSGHHHAPKVAPQIYDRSLSWLEEHIYRQLIATLDNFLWKKLNETGTCWFFGSENCHAWKLRIYLKILD